ncbi:MAG: hypothetical protein ABL890_00485 [Candidatus Peribacteraceae bacterium]
MHILPSRRRSSASMPLVLMHVALIVLVTVAMVTTLPAVSL